MENDELKQLKSDISELKVNVSTLTTNVNSIKSDMTEMKQSVSSAMEKISDSSVKMATVLEKLNHNLEDHKTLHKRIDELKDTQEYYESEVEALKVSHQVCQTSLKLKSEAEENSIWSDVKKKATEYIVIGFVLLTFFTLYKNLEHFIQSYFPVSEISEEVKPHKK